MRQQEMLLAASDVPGTPQASEGERLSVHVRLGALSYDVLIGAGLLEHTASLLAARFPGARFGIVTDENVARHYLPPLEEGLRKAGLLAGTAVLPPGEASKSFAQLAPLCERLLEMRIERSDMVIALGGGVVGDLAGFAASILRRGVRFVQVPTTLLAQVDSSAGGKTGIDTPQGKNLIGTFHQPSLVVADPATLATLPGREVRAGYAEVVKYGLLGNAAFFSWLETNAAALLAGDPAAVSQAIATCVRMKAAVVERDEKESGERALLNLGHTFGHALEAWTGYGSRLLHGEGVAVGMCLAFRLSERLGVCPAGSAARVSAHLAAAGLPVHISDVLGEGVPDVDTLLELMRQDKKVKQGKLTLILVREIGAAFVAGDVPEETLRGFLLSEIG